MPLHRSHQIPQLDGLRGLAILLVVSQHNFGFLPVFSFGWSGLDLFFVLSGYLITGRLLEKRGKPGYFRNFYRNRALRILPLYYGALIIFFMAVHFLAKKEHLPELSWYAVHWKSFYLFTQNWAFIIYGVPTAIYLLHFWSLAVEEQFYLVWPALVHFLESSRSRIILCLALVPVAIIIRVIIFFTHPGSGNGINTLFNTFCRMDSFAIGALLCEIHRAKIRVPGWMVNLALALSVTAITISLFIWRNLAPANPFFGTVGTTFTAILYGCILYKSLAPTAVGASSAPGRFFSAPILRFFGKISYGLYVIHFPILLILYTRLYDWGLDRLQWSAPVLQASSAAVCLLISVLVSMISFRYFESFFLRLKSR